MLKGERDTSLSTLSIRFVSPRPGAVRRLKEAAVASALQQADGGMGIASIIGRGISRTPEKDGLQQTTIVRPHQSAREGDGLVDECAKAVTPCAR